MNKKVVRTLLLLDKQIDIICHGNEEAVRMHITDKRNQISQSIRLNSKEITQLRDWLIVITTGKLNEDGK